MDEKCYCHRCLKERDEKIGVIPYAMARMVVCPKCGDKRCPHAQDHRNDCTPPHTVRRPTETDLLRARITELEHFTQQVYDEAQEQRLVAQAGLLLHPLQP